MPCGRSRANPWITLSRRRSPLTWRRPLTVPLAFAGFQFDEQSDPVEVMQALRGMSGRMDIFCQAGAIHAKKWPS